MEFASRTEVNYPLNYRKNLKTEPSARPNALRDKKNENYNHDDRPDFRNRFAPRVLGDGSEPSDALVRYREVSPINYLKKDSPPLLMIQGDKDTTIPVKHAYYMKEKSKAIGAPVEIMIIKNAGHNWRKVDAEVAPTQIEIIDHTVKFFVDQL